MTYLLDVNLLLCLVHHEHDQHQRVANWIESLGKTSHAVATCSIVELGVVRIMPQLPDVDYTVEEVQQLLSELKSALPLPIEFIADDLDVSKLPKWVKQPRQTTDGHLAALAKSHGCILATLDTRIPGTFLIPSS